MHISLQTQLKGLKPLVDKLTQKTQNPAGTKFLAEM